MDHCAKDLQPDAHLVRPLLRRHFPLLPRIDAPEFAPQVWGLKGAVPPVGILLPIKGETSLHHFSREVTSVFQHTDSHGTFMGEASIRVGRYDLTFAKADKRALGNFAEGLIHFGRIDPGEANMDLVDHDRVAINDPAPSFEDFLLAAGGRQVRRARWRMGHRVIGRTERDDLRLRRWRGVALLSSGWREEFLEKTEHISCQGNKVGTN